MDEQPPAEVQGTPHQRPVAAEPPAEDEQPLWKLSRDEQRVLLITFVGGLASIIVGACLIGLVIAFARYEEHQTGFSYINLVSYTAALTLLALLSYLGMRRPGRLRRISDVVLTVCVVQMILAVLTWIGIAAGIH